METTFSVEQVTALCGGKLPESKNGFVWRCVEHFQLENGVLEPYKGDMILPGPGIRITAKVEDLAFG